MRTERIRETSFACLLVFGLKSQSRPTLSHSDPGVSPLVSATKASSDALQVGGRPGKDMNELQYWRDFRTAAITAKPSEPNMVLKHKVQSHEQHYAQDTQTSCVSLYQSYILLETCLIFIM